jgi:hypothetical protein
MANDIIGRGALRVHDRSATDSSWLVEGWGLRTCSSILLLDASCRLEPGRAAFWGTDPVWIHHRHCTFGTCLGVMYKLLFWPYDLKLLSWC